MASFSSAEALLAHVEGQTHSQRWSTMINIGRRSVAPQGDSALQSSIASLAQSDVQYERLLAAMAVRGAAGARSSGHAVTPLPPPLAAACRTLSADPARHVAKLVWEPLAATSSDEELHSLLTAAPLSLLRSLARSLSSHGRLSVLEALYTEAVAAPAGSLPPARVAELASYMSAAELKKMPVHDAVTQLSTRALVQLARRQPAVLVDRLLDAVESCSTASQEELPPAVGKAILTAAAALVGRPHGAMAEQALRLAERALHRVPSEDYSTRRSICDVLSRLLCLKPTETARYLLREKAHYADTMCCRFSKRVWRKLSTDAEMVESVLAAEVADDAEVSSLLPALAVPVRCHLLKHHPQLFVDDRSVMDPRTVRALPTAEEREREARRNFGLQALSDDPRARIKYVGVLPFAEAKALVDPYATNPDPDLRIATISQLVRTASYHVDDLPAVVEHCAARAKENDPFRQAMFRALARLPPRLWGSATAQKLLPKLQALVETATDAKDVSQGTYQCTSELLVKVAHHHVSFAVPLLTRTYQRQHSLMCERALATAPPATIAALVTGLSSLLHSLQQSGKHSDALSVIQTFSTAQVRRLWSTHLRAFVEPALRAKDAGVVEDALVMCERYDPVEQYAAEVARLLDSEPDAYLLRVSMNTIVRRLQGAYLDRVLQPVAGAPPEGRFRRHRDLSEMYYYTVPTHPYARQWSAQQQRTYAKTLVSALEEHYADDQHEARGIVEKLADLSSAPFAEGLGRLVSAQYPQTYTRDLAIGALSRLTDSASMHELLSGLSDTRVRESSVAIQRRLRQSTSTQAVATLRPLLMDTKMVTVQKELVRFIGDLADSEAFACLRAFDEAKGSEMHKDVRIAFMRAMWSYLDRRDVWRYFHEAARSARAADGVAAAGIPIDRLREEWQLQAMNDVIVVLLAHPENEVQSAALEWILAQTPPRLEDPRIHAALLNNLSRVREGRIASQSMQCVLRSRTLSPETAAERIATLPSAEALSDAVQGITASGRRRGGVSSAALARVQTMASDVVQRLIAARRQSSLAVQLVMFGECAQWADTLLGMEQGGLLHPGAANTAVEAMEGLDSRRTEEAEKSEPALRASSSALLRRVGLAIVKVAARRFRWTAERRKVLLLYRADTDSWVSDDAELVYLPPEAETESA